MILRTRTREISTFLGLACSQTFAGLGLLLLGRRLTPAEFGSYASVSVAAITISSFLDSGSSTIQIRRVAQGTPSAFLHSWLARRTLRQTAAALLLGGPLFGLLGGRLPPLAVVFLLSQMCTHTFSMGSLVLIRAQGRAALAGWLTALGNLVFLTTAALSPPSDLVTAAALAATTSWLITGSAALLISQKSARPGTAWTGNPWRGVAGFAWLTFASGLAGFELLALKFGVGSERTASYAAVSSWTQPLLLIMYAYTASMFAEFASRSSFAEAYKLIQSARPFLITTTGLLGLLALCGPLLVSRLFGTKYPEATTLLAILSVGSIFVAWTQPYLSLLQSRGDERYVAWLYGGVTALRLAVIAIGGTFFGPRIAPATLIVSSIVLLGTLRKRCLGLEKASCSEKPWAASTSFGG